LHAASDAAAKTDEIRRTEFRERADEPKTCLPFVAIRQAIGAAPWRDHTRVWRIGFWFFVWPLCHAR